MSSLSHREELQGPRKNCWKWLIQFPRGGNNWMIQILPRRELLDLEWEQLWGTLILTDGKEASSGYRSGLGEVVLTLGAHMGLTIFLRPSVSMYITTLPDAIWTLIPKMLYQRGQSYGNFLEGVGLQLIQKVLMAKWWTWHKSHGPLRRSWLVSI